MSEKKMYFYALKIRMVRNVRFHEVAGKSRSGAESAFRVVERRDMIVLRF